MIEKISLIDNTICYDRMIQTNKLAQKQTNKQTSKEGNERWVKFFSVAGPRIFSCTIYRCASPFCRSSF